MKNISRKYLVKYYIQNKKSIRQVVEILGESYSTIYRRLKKYNLIRNKKEASKISIHKKDCNCGRCKAKRGEFKGQSNFQFGKRSFNYIDGRTLKIYYCKDCNKKITYQSAIYGKGLCQSCVRVGKNSFFFGKKRPKHSKRMKGKGNPMFGKSSSVKKNQYKSGYYKSVYMRSSYEIAYAKYLDENKIKWLYESKRFDLGDSTYCPDFYILRRDLYVEIKGWWKDKEKFKLFKKLYPKIKIEILFKNDLQRLGITLHKRK